MDQINTAMLDLDVIFQAMRLFTDDWKMYLGFQIAEIIQASQGFLGL